MKMAIASTENTNPTPYLAVPAVYEFTHCPHFQKYCRERWWMWGWCHLGETIELINKAHGLHWGQLSFLKRFALPAERGKVMLPDGKFLSHDLNILWHRNGTDELRFLPYTKSNLPPVVARRDWTAFVPPSWIRDVLWALQLGCRRADVDATCRKFACTEEGEGIFFMTQTTSSLKKILKVVDSARSDPYPVSA